MDFCSSFLGTKISVNKPCRDGFSVTNLISDSKEEFLCEGFVRTPVNIDIKFILPIDIYCILINTEVRERKIAGLKLFANTKDSEEYCVGNWFSLSESQIILRNYEYRHLLPFSIPKEVEVEIESSLNTGSIIKAFKTRSFKNVGVSSLQLVLTSVSPNGPPGLKRLQIWGQPTLTVSPSLKSNIIKLWSSRSKKKEHEKINMNWFNSQPVKEEDNSEAVKEISNDEEKPIPEEFLDILTCEVMRLPILLPSGNSIDSSSLEKFLAIEATWGRSPSDPFTGIPFKENHKPEPNILLKARIDRFLLIEKNSSCLDGLGHTLLTNYIEKGPNNSQVQESKRLKLDNSSSRSVVSTNTSHRNSSCSSIVNNNSSSSSKKRVEISNASNKQEKVKKLKFNKINEEKRLISAPSRTSFLHTLGSAISSVQKNKSCVLLKGTKNPLTNVERSSVTTNVEDKSVECNDSKTDKYTLAGMALSSFKCKCGSQTGTFYSLKCEHKICHACLKSQLIKSNVNKSIICNKCSAYSLSSDVVRVHPKSAFQI